MPDRRVGNCDLNLRMFQTVLYQAHADAGKLLVYLRSRALLIELAFINVELVGQRPYQNQFQELVKIRTL